MNPVTIISAIGSLVELALRLRESLKQSAELTPEQEQELDAHIAKVTAQPHWKPNSTTEVPGAEP